ncbi:hypothetical protein ACLOJK_031622 [Asimina triloba]
MYREGGGKNLQGFKSCLGRTAPEELEAEVPGATVEAAAQVDILIIEAVAAVLEEVEGDLKVVAEVMEEVEDPAVAEVMEAAEEDLMAVAEAMEEVEEDTKAVVEVEDIMAVAAATVGTAAEVVEVVVVAAAVAERVCTLHISLFYGPFSFYLALGNCLHRLLVKLVILPAGAIICMFDSSLSRSGPFDFAYSAWPTMNASLDGMVTTVGYMVSPQVG